jgi:urease accessory protein
VHGADPEVVFLNTAGGVTGGDEMAFRLDVGVGARAVATTQTAERAYASTGADAALDIGLTVGAAGSLDWLPQETILFDRSRLRRRTTIALHGDARCLLAETVVLGRAAMGERIGHLDFSDLRQVTRDGVPVLIEPLRLGADALARRGNAAILGPATAFATVALVAPGAEDALGPVRAALAGLDAGVEAAASGWDGKCILRAVARDAFALRRLVACVLNTLRPGPLPRVWQF